jgi:hypothetical protein
MSWAIILVTILEVAEENLFAMQKKSDRASQRKVDETRTDGIKQRLDSVEGGVLALDSRSFIDSRKALQQQLEQQYLLLVNTYKASLYPVFRDARYFGVSHQRRSRETVDRVFSQEANSSSATIKSAFDQNLWPLLTNRGWKAEQVIRGQGNSIRYIFGNAIVSY